MSDPSRNNCEKALNLLTNQLEKENFDLSQLDHLCQQYPACSEQLRSTFDVWNGLEEIEAPEPSQKMHTAFYKMLNEFQAEKAPNKTQPNYSWLNWQHILFRWIFVAGIFLLGIVCGITIWSNQSVDLTAEKEQNRFPDEGFTQLISSTSAVDRLQGIQLFKNMEKVDEQTIEALFQVLISDDNINVRLSAIETMVFFLEYPQVRTSLIKAVPFQDAPLIQLTLAEVILALNDKRAIKEIQQLLQTQPVEVEVKMKLEDTIEQLL